MAKTILVFITTNLSRALQPTQVLVDIGPPDGQRSGLRQNSVISCENILTVVQDDVLRALGHIPDTPMAQVDVALKVALGL